MQKTVSPHHVQDVEDALGFREDAVQDGVLVPGPALQQQQHTFHEGTVPQDSDWLDVPLN